MVFFKKDFFTQKIEEMKWWKKIIIWLWVFIILLLILFFISFIIKRSVGENFKDYSYQLNECWLNKEEIKKIQKINNRLYAELLLNCFDYIDRKEEEKLWIQRDQNWKILFPIQMKK